MNRKIVKSLLFGAVCGIINLVLNFTDWFREDGYSWWRPIAFGCTMAILSYFVFIPLAGKQNEKRQRAKSAEDELK